MNLTGKTAVITGAALRIGAEIARTLARSGAALLLHYHRSKQAASSLKREIEDLGSSAFLIQADFSSPSKPLLPKIESFVRKIYRLVPRVDILINNASIFYPVPLEKITEREWDDFLTVNLKAPFFLAREIGLRMAKQKGGKIINLVDWTGTRPHPRYLPYAISKAGLIAATIGLARVLAPHVQVNSIAPGPILPARGAASRQERRVIEKTLLKRYGNPRDIAETVKFLCEGTDFITGAMIPVDGGAPLS